MSCNRRELELKWAAEKQALRHECHVELRRKLLDVAQAHKLAVNEDRKPLHALEDETLINMEQKLDAVALSGKRLSHVFMNSLAATFAHRMAAVFIQSRNQQKQGLATDEARATQEDNVNDHQNSGRNPTVSSAPGSDINPSSPNRCMDTTSRHPLLSHTSAAIKYEYAQSKFRGGGALTLEGLLFDYFLARPPDDDTCVHSVQTQLAALVQERADLDRQLSEERNLLAKRSAYLRECRMAAVKEKDMAREVLSAAMLSLTAAEKERTIAANYKAAALEELKHIISLRKHSTQGTVYPSLGLAGLETPQENLGSNAPTTWVKVHQLPFDITPGLSPPLSTDHASPLMLPESPDETESNGHRGGSSSTPAATDGDNAMHPKVLMEFNKNDERRDDSVVSHSGAKDEVVNVSRTLENPIGPYIRPPMPVADMLKCVRCLFGKDKSLKTGNRARAFLGVPWSQIVSFDPDVLLGRGVLGIKEGSTGMASRLRMMTIIESALSNQNDDTIPAEVWETPTHFCESCQKRYPITVNSNQLVIPFEEQRETDFTLIQVSAESPRNIQETTKSKGKRNRKRLPRTRPGTHPLR